MNKTSKSEKIPEQMQALHDRIAGLIDDYCSKNLNAEYARLAKNAVATLCCTDPSPLAKGHINTWACAIIYTLCTINRLFEDEQELHINTSDLCSYFEISTNTALNKSNVVKDTLQIDDNDPNWCLKIKPDVKPDIKPNNKPEIKPEVKTEVKPDIKPEVKSEIKSVETPVDKKELKRGKTKDRSAKKDDIKVGDCVKVKKGVSDPDFADSSIEGWHGRIIDFVKTDDSEVDKDNPVIDIEWDSITLRGMTDDYIDKCEEDDLDCLSMYLRLCDVERVKPRDTAYDVKEAQEEIHKYLDEAVVANVPNEQDKRIREILGDNDITVSEETLACYLDYLEKNIAPPCQLTGKEPFGWEEPYYLFGHGKKREYDKLRKTRPSHNDTFKFIKMERELSIEDGIFVKVQRLSDDKKFVLPLSSLKVTIDKSPNYKLIDDYSYWFVNN
ncbi:MAG: hypothetical protein HQL03_11715 [Nitrospirae bacterium]|nr:hypothetical protein [Nitrospirota bacterium]MBF0591732.1 hypothetical protein [Nitrospirota bacterium]